MTFNKKLQLTIFGLCVANGVALAKGESPAATPIKFDRLPAQSANEIVALTDEKAKWHVAQVRDIQYLNVKKFEGIVALASVYNGGIAMPFEGILTVFDPTPQDGGDFGTFKSFSLGRTSGLVNMIDSKLYDIKADEKVLSIAFTATQWDPNTDKTSVKIIRFRVLVHAGEVSGKATLSVSDK